ncbi:MAG: hypothetical protein H0T89_16355 [Deltaproteobacteria bacterium]|nr:hypothetical protein [Deltaproteobacteria bacterium]
MSAPDVTYADEAALVRVCADADGLRFLRDGFAYTAQDDRLFALGWPHARILDADHEDADDPMTPLEEMLEDEENRPYEQVWPLEVARRFVRVLGAREQRASTASLAAVAKRGEPVTAAEARELVTNAVTRIGYNEGDLVEHFVLLLEAMVGAEPVLEAAIDAFERLAPGAWASRNADAGEVLFELGFILLRAPGAIAVTYRRRLADLWSRITTGGRPESEQADALDAVVNNAEGATRAGGKARDMYAHVTGAPELLAKVVRESEYIPDARFIFLGGEGVLAELARQWKDWDAATFLADLGRIRGPGVVEIVRAMSVRSDAKPEAKAWLRDHAGGAIPAKSEAATKAATGAKAKAAKPAGAKAKAAKPAGAKARAAKPAGAKAKAKPAAKAKARRT